MDETIGRIRRMRQREHDSIELVRRGLVYYGFDGLSASVAMTEPVTTVWPYLFHWKRLGRTFEVAVRELS